MEGNPSSADVRNITVAWGRSRRPMRKYFLLLWLLFPVAVIYYHYNDGQDDLAREKAREHLNVIRQFEKAKEPDWQQIVEEYDKVAAALPANERPLVRHQIRLAKAKAKLEMLDVAGAIEDLTLLLRNAAEIHGQDVPITRAIRETLGKAYYYATTLLKTNGATEDEWRPFAERTRQIFRYLAEHQDTGALP
ncbi:MAG: hypothetical protein EBU04_04720 [Verrucomicrobia bacterium]|nr:hypothetical protein [Verrucomicrobiota bacterium]